MNPLGDAVGQCKWIWFRHKDDKLSIFSSIDGASRGPYGSLKALLALREIRWFGMLTCGGAALTVFTVAINPFIQQLIRTEFRDVQRGAASVPVSTKYGFGGGFFEPNLTIMAAAYSGFVSLPNSTFNVTANCPSGNCTWTSFETIGVCSSCQNITSLLKHRSSDQEYWNLSASEQPEYFELPNNHRLTPQEMIVGPQAHYAPLSIMNITSTWMLRRKKLPSSANNTESPPPNDSSLVFDDRGSELVDFFVIRNAPGSQPYAAECILQFCVQSLEAVEKNGSYSENVRSAWSNNTAAARTSFTGTDQLDPINEYYLTAPGSNRTFIVDQTAQSHIIDWLLDTLNGTAANLPPDAGRSYTNDQIYRIDNGFNYGEEVVSAIIDNVARSMTAAMRSSDNSSAPGVTLVSDAYYAIRWQWITLPLALYILPIAFIILVIVAGRGGRSGRSTQVWKNSVNAALFHGLDTDTRRGFGLLNSETSIDDTAESLLVGMLLGREGWWQLSSEDGKQALTSSNVRMSHLLID